MNHLCLFCSFTITVVSNELGAILNGPRCPQTQLKWKPGKFELREKKKLNKLLGYSSSPRLCQAWQPAELELRTWHATWFPEILHCKLPLLWPAWRAAPWQGVVWCFLKPGLFLEDKKKGRKKAAVCRHLCCAAFAVPCLMFVVIRKSMSWK